MSATVIEIDRLPLTFVTAASSDRAELVWRRARDAIIRTLLGSIASAWGAELDAADDAYVFIDRLHIQCAIATHWLDDAVASAFADRLVETLRRERGLGRELAFHDRAEFLSSFLVAVVDGQASTRWWFAEFEGLARLPVSACIRTLVVAEHFLGWNALARLSPEGLFRVVSSLDAADAERMLAAVRDGPSGSSVTVSGLVEALDPVLGLPLSSSIHRVILALINMLRSDAVAPSARTVAAIRAVVAIVEAARAGRLPGLVADGTATRVLRWCEAARVEGLDRAAALDLDLSELVGYVETQMRSRPDGESSETSDAEQPFDFTPSGGALLLCVVLVRTGWWAAWSDALRATRRGDRAEALASWLGLAIVARALRPERPTVIERDPVLRRVFHLPPRPAAMRHDQASTEALLGALRVVEEVARVAPGRPELGWRLRAWAQALLLEFGRRIPGCDGASDAYLRSQCLSLPAAVRSDGAAARLGPAPLDVLLGFSGLKRACVTLPDGSGLDLSEELAL